MPLATLTLELAIEHAQSLKDRRQAVRSLKDKLRHSFNISIAELDDALVWNRATLGVAAISNSSSYLAARSNPPPAVSPPASASTSSTALSSLTFRSMLSIMKPGDSSHLGKN
jgi:uncharacterized protein YlxP (DUF503 family)